MEQAHSNPFGFLPREDSLKNNFKFPLPLPSINFQFLRHPLLFDNLFQTILLRSLALYFTNVGIISEYILFRLFDEADQYALFSCQQFQNYALKTLLRRIVKIIDCHPYLVEVPRKGHLDVEYFIIAEFKHFDEFVEGKKLLRAVLGDSNNEVNIVHSHLVIF